MAPQRKLPKKAPQQKAEANSAEAGEEDSLETKKARANAFLKTFTKKKAPLKKKSRKAAVASVYDLLQVSAGPSSAEAGPSGLQQTTHAPQVVLNWKDDPDAKASLLRLKTVELCKLMEHLLTLNPA